MTNVKKALRRKLLPFAVSVAVIALVSTGCNGKTVKSPPAGATSGTDQVLNNPNSTPEMKAQAAQQQQMAQQQARALRQAQTRQQGAGQNQGH